MSSYERQLAMWPVQRDQRAGMNDDLLVPREVEHFAYFTRRRKAASAADDLVTSGFTVATARRGLKIGLQASRRESLSDESVARFLREVISVVEIHDGNYDGWGATVEVRDPV
ncbi:ribonuclease E inhibitor RraB [Microbacterium sp. PMB16]|uniref:ribonuclease E inhibitor RraB n=1 Tax=Microbacterium sp. PMB16 TaxID=3120157 RepID=UPI003F4C4468